MEGTTWRTHFKQLQCFKSSVITYVLKNTSTEGQKVRFAQFKCAIMEMPDGHFFESFLEKVCHTHINEDADHLFRPFKQLFDTKISILERESDLSW